MDMAGFLDLGTLTTPSVVVAILAGLPLTLFVLQVAERCQQCGSRKLQAQSQADHRWPGV
jgi:hypothetical protein